MLTVTQSQDGQYLIIKSHYYYSQRIKNSIPSALWNHEGKFWQINKNDAITLETEFHDEIYYKTPAWIIFNRPKPDYSNFYKLPESIVAPQLQQPYKLYDYQEFGARFAIDKIDKHGFCIIADDVGLGKTPQAISILLDRINKGNDKILIICKKSIKTQWKEEIEKFTDIGLTYNIQVTGDTAKKRQKAYDEVNNSQKGILITNYQTFLNDESKLSQIGFDFVIIDEAHVISGHGTKTNTLIQHTVKGKPCLFLTGTPVMNKPEQAYGIISIANPNYFGSWSNFKKEFIIEQFQGNYTATIGAKNLSKLRSMIQDVMIRRTEYEVSVSLPKTIEIKVDCPLDGVQETLISEINKKREELLSEFEYTMTQYNINHTQELYQKLAQTDAQIKGLIAATQATADDPRMFDMSTSQYLKKNFLQFIPSNYKQSSKIEKLVDIVDNIVNSGHKVIIFTKFRTSALLIQNQLQKDLKVNAVLYTGQENDNTRQQNLNNFKYDDDYPVLIGTEAMAEGLNITEAKYVINFNLPDTAAIYTQRIGRVRRVSSTFNNVVVYNLITESSKDEERWENIERNKNLEGALISVDEAQQEALINAMKSGGKNE